MAGEPQVTFHGSNFLPADRRKKFNLPQTQKDIIYRLNPTLRAGRTDKKRQTPGHILTRFLTSAVALELFFRFVWQKGNIFVVDFSYA